MKVSKKKVRYLVFEGGGGKGLIYLGVVKALGETGVLEYITKQISGNEVYRLNPKKIRGVAGTSVGSLAATLIASGYTPDELHHILTQDFGMYVLDKIDYGTIPTVSTKENPGYIVKNQPIPEDRETLDNYWRNYIKTDKRSFKRIMRLPGKAFTHLNRKFFVSLMKWWLDYKERQIAKNSSESELDDFDSIFKMETTKTAFEKVLESPDTMNSLKYDLGLFLSEFIREFIDSQIEKKSGIKNCTFQQFYNEFGIDLVITGFNITRNEILYFRNEGIWRDLSVADAVRMSVSIPLIFKPVFFCYDDSKIYPIPENVDLKKCDLMVDGGVGNNFPLHVFDESRSRSSRLNNQVLGFRLKRTRNECYDEELTLAQFIEKIGFSLLGQTTELQIRTDEEKDQVIELEHEGINTLDFLYSEKTQRYIDMAYDTTMEYFE
ncbi:MAG: patatin-like phospholipase family protein [Candidatus Lokiarchaeota archaeon]|nr:patatin-like phospholipase family protein [Candidatus Lokiarchaeota archaeon]